MSGGFRDARFPSRLPRKAPPPRRRAPAPEPQAPHAQRVYPAIRVGLKQVKGMCRADIDSILAARAEAPFTSLEDFCRRTTVPRDVVENLILCGAFDSLNPHRRRLLWTLDAALALRNPPPGDGQLTLEAGVQESGFGVQGSESSSSSSSSPSSSSSAVPNPQSAHSNIELPVPTPAERVRWEVNVLGLCVHTHPTALFRERLAPYGVTPAGDLPGLPDGARVRVAGVVLCRMRPPTKSGAVVVFITLEDETGLVDTVIFSGVYDEYGKAAFASELLVVEGRVQKQGARAITLVAEKVFNPLEEAAPDRIDGRTGFARKEMVVPAAEYAPPPVTRDYHPGEEDEFHERFVDPYADDAGT